MKIFKYMKNPFLAIKYLKTKRLAGEYGKSLDDEAFLKKAFKLNMGKELNLKNPQTFNEKLQWLKLYNRKPEYTIMADLYDKFYAKKDYKKEVEFICKFISQKDSNILDAGCGTGNHAKILKDLGYNVYGFDLSADMVSIANTKIPEHFSVANLLKFTSEKKYDCIISFFAVFNHLKNYKEFKIALQNLKKCLKKTEKITKNSLSLSVFS